MTTWGLADETVAFVTPITRATIARAFGINPWMLTSAGLRMIPTIRAYNGAQRRPTQTPTQTEEPVTYASRDDINTLINTFGPWIQDIAVHDTGVVDIECILQLDTTHTGDTDRQIRTAAVDAAQDKIDAAITLGWRPTRAPRITLDGELIDGTRDTTRTVIHECRLTVTLWKPA